MKEKKPKKPKNYLNNKDMLAELKRSKEQGKMSNELTNMIMMLCRRYGKHPWFINYSYNDDMQSFALLTIVKFWDRFDPEKSKNAFAYFTQIIKRAFYQFKIQEKKHRNIRDLLLIEHGERPSHTFTEEYDDDNYYFHKLDNFENEELKTFEKGLGTIDAELEAVTVPKELEKGVDVVELVENAARGDQEPIEPEV